jgi:transcriptional regulator with XRE-family HTH domain
MLDGETSRLVGDWSLQCRETLLFNSIKVNGTRMNRPAQLELIGRKIRQLRRQRKLTQVELAERIGIHQSDLSRMEQGEYKVGLDALLKILQAFDLSIGDFFEENARTENVVQKLKALSPTTQKEVEDFIEFKRRQERERWDDEQGEGGDGDA